jgi:hypothetical protein
MHEPTLEEFDLTEALLRKAKVIDDRLPFILFFTSGIIIVIIFILSGEFSFHPILLLLGVLVWFSISLLLMGILLIPSELIIRVIFSYYGRTKKYQKALDQYQKWWTRTQQEFWTSLSGLQFENELANLFRKLGVRAEQTTASDDKGVDIWLHTEKGKEIVQCKAHKNPITPHVVRELYGTLKHFKAAQAILASTSGFTKGVFEFSKDKPIRLLDLNGIIAMQKKIDMQRKVII